MRARGRLVTSVGLALVAAACSGGNARLTPPAATPANAARRTAAVTLHIKIPKKCHVVRVLRGGKPAYVSAATEALTLSIAGPVNVPSEVIGLTPSSPACSGGPTGATCSATISGLVPCPSHVPCYSATIATYDAIDLATNSIPAGANELSAAQDVGFVVAPGKANVLQFTLGGIPASVAVAPLMPGYLRGDSRALKIWGPNPQRLIVTPLDADGNAIVGPGAPTIAASPSATSLSVTGPTAAAPNVVTLRAPAFGTPAVVTPGVVDLSVTVTPASQSGATAVTTAIPVNVAHSVVYVGFLASVEEFLDGNGTPSVTISGGKTGIASAVSSLAVGENGTIYATLSGSNSILEFGPNATGNIAPLITLSGASTGLSGPAGPAVDSTARTYVSNAGANSVTEYAAGANGNAAPSSTLSGSSTLLNVPQGIALDANGNIYVPNNGANAISIFAAGSKGNVIAASISGANTELLDAAFPALLPDGTLCVMSTIASNQAIVEFAPGATGNVAPIRAIVGPATGLVVASSLAADIDGTLYSVNGNTVSEYPPNATGDEAPAITFSTVGASSVAVSPSSLTP